MDGSVGNQQQEPQPDSEVTWASKSSSMLLLLCDELLLSIFAFLDVPELLNSSRTCHRLRHISLDPVLHSHRLHHTVPSLLTHSLSHRPPLSHLLPPNSTIYLSSTLQRARDLSRSLIAIRLNRSLSRRPSASHLRECNILPEECFSVDKSTGECVWGGGVAWGIVGVKRRVEKERVKDGLRAWVGGRAVEEARKRANCVANDDEARRKPSVRSLVQRFARRAGCGSREQQQQGSGFPGGLWGAAAAAEKRRRLRDPPRAHVLKLRRFWESVGRQGQGLNPMPA